MSRKRCQLHPPLQRELMALPATDFEGSCPKLASQMQLVQFVEQCGRCSWRSAWRSGSERFCSRASRSMANKPSKSATAHSNFASGAWAFVCTLMASMNPRLACAKQQAWIRFFVRCLFIGDVSIGVEDSSIVFEELFGDLLAAVISKSKTTPLPGALYCQSRVRGGISPPRFSQNWT